MKDYLPFKRQKLPNHLEQGLWKSLKRTAIEHGYKGFLFRTRFLYRRLMDFQWQVLSRVAPHGKIRVIMQRWRGVKIGKNVKIGPLVTIDDVYPNFVKIEDNVAISGQTFILTHNKPSDYHKYVSEAILAPVIIKKHAWIAIGVTILPGVTIGEGSIVSAGSVVSKDLPALVIAAGNPAKVVVDISHVLRKNYSDEEYQKIRSERKEKFGI